MTRRRITAATLLLPLLLLGCSDDPANDPAEPTPSPAATSAGAAPTSSTDPDAAAAAAINLNAADLGPGWTSTPAVPPEPGAGDVERALYSCVGLTPVDPVADDVASPDFANAEGGQIASSVDFYDSAATAQAELSAFATPKGLECLRTSLAGRLQTEASAYGGSVSKVTLTRSGGGDIVPGSVAFSFTASVAAGDQAASVTGDLVAVVRGRVAVQVTSYSVGTPVPRDLVVMAVRAVTLRAEAHPA